MAKMPQFVQKIVLWIRKEHSVSYWSMLKFILFFFVHYFFFWVPIYLSVRLTVPDGTIFSSSRWWSISSGAFALVVINYFWDNYRDRAKNKTIESDKIIYDCIGGAIQELHEINSNNPSGYEHYIDEILVYVEKVIIAVLKSTGVPCGTLCVNFMVQNGDSLKLTKFATKYQDRDKPEIKLDLELPLPGAPEAWVLKKTIYINDIDSQKYKEYFKDNYKFKSFISIPVLNNKDVFGIINIDSNIKDQFVSDDYISKKIMTKINPLLLLFAFEDELFKTNKKKGT